MLRRQPPQRHLLTPARGLAGPHPRRPGAFTPHRFDPEKGTTVKILKLQGEDIPDQPGETKHSLHSLFQCHGSHVSWQCP